MEKTAIELWALDALGHADLNRAVSPELKRVRIYNQLPPVQKCARELAALANAAQGQDLLWVITPGSAKTAKALPGRKDLEKWRTSVQQQFEGISPSINELRLETEQGTPALALHIETDRAPFVTYRAGKARKDGSRPTEVLWMRETKPQPARRVDLIKLVAPLRDLPSLEVIAAELTLYENANRRLEPSVAYLWSLDATVYIVPGKGEKLVLPFRKCRTSLESVRNGFRSEAAETTLSANKETSALHVTESALMVNGVGQFYLFASGTTAEENPPTTGELSISVYATPAGFSQASLTTADLQNVPTQDAPNQAARWRLE